MRGVCASSSTNSGLPGGTLRGVHPNSHLPGGSSTVQRVCAVSSTTSYPSGGTLRGFPTNQLPVGGTTVRGVFAGSTSSRPSGGGSAMLRGGNATILCAMCMRSTDTITLGTNISGVLCESPMPYMEGHPSPILPPTYTGPLHANRAILHRNPGSLPYLEVSPTPPVEIYQI